MTDLSALWDAPFPQFCILGYKLLHQSSAAKSKYPTNRVLAFCHQVCVNNSPVISVGGKLELNHPIIFLFASCLPYVCLERGH